MNANLLKKALGTTALACAFAATAQAGDLPSAKEPPAPPPVVETFHPFFVKLGYTYAINQSHSYITTPLGPTGAGATVSNVSTLGFEAGMFLTKNISINVSGGVPVKANYAVKGTASNIIVATAAPNGTVLTKAMPAIIPITAVYHVTSFGAFQPYAGVGIGPGFSFSNDNAFLSNVKLTGALNTVVQFGFDYMVTERWGVSFDVKKAWAYLKGNGTVATGSLAGNPVNTEITFEPWILSTGIVYRFGGHDALPIVAKY